MPALRHYFKLFVHTEVDERFVISRDPKRGGPRNHTHTNSGPQSAESSTLGGLAKHAERSAQKLKEPNFPPARVSKKVWTKRIMPALETYVSLFGIEDSVPPSFVVP